jgi:hypothetical protein
MRSVRGLAALAVVGMLSACKGSTPEDPPGGGGAGGNAGVGSSLELEPLQLLGQSDLVPLVDGTDAPLSFAVQGGEVFYVAARVRGLGDSGFVVATGRLVDPDTGSVQTAQTRTIELVPDPSDPTAMIPNTDGRSHVVHLVVCPNYAERDIMGLPWRLEIEMREAYGDRSGACAVTITPICPVSAPEFVALCECECTARYDLRVCEKPR